ncbi:polynucleotidyl transferase [Striga asiatica]|uniref:Polynucleotidyl transferase n=1 Tax=Striga asiatica TaxID=4170 RepID=A0A5A7PCH9_STRAF|nr:polynucleotidyl transferase [Striga asiatica]
MFPVEPVEDRWIRLPCVESLPSERVVRRRVLWDYNGGTRWSDRMDFVQGEAQGRLMTNVERGRRHLSPTVSCHKCSLHEETLLHVLRDCAAATQVWLRLVPVVARPKFFCLQFRSWLTSNLFNRPHILVDDDSWEYTFGVTLWKIWLWRNSSVREIRAFVNSILHFAEGARKVGSTGTTRFQRLVCWEPPSDSWIKMNSDGAHNGSSGLASAGGLLRDSHGAWVGGFVMMIGECSIMAAELWGLFQGLTLAWNLRYRRVEAEVRISHIYREANFAADYIATLAASTALGCHQLAAPPSGVVPWIEHDLKGVSYPRNSNLTFSVDHGSPRVDARWVWSECVHVGCYRFVGLGFANRSRVGCCRRQACVRACASEDIGACMASLIEAGRLRRAMFSGEGSERTGTASQGGRGESLEHLGACGYGERLIAACCWRAEILSSRVRRRSVVHGWYTVADTVVSHGLRVAEINPSGCSKYIGP